MISIEEAKMKIKNKYSGDNITLSENGEKYYIFLVGDIELGSPITLQVNKETGEVNNTSNPSYFFKWRRASSPLSFCLEVLKYGNV